MLQIHYFLLPFLIQNRNLVSILLSFSYNTRFVNKCENRETAHLCDFIIVRIDPINQFFEEPEDILTTQVSVAEVDFLVEFTWSHFEISWNMLFLLL